MSNCVRVTERLCPDEFFSNLPISRSRDYTCTACGTTGPGPNHTSAKGFVLEDGTPVKMRINRTVSSADAHVGDTIDFEVLEDVSVNGTLVIPKGGVAFATVTAAQAKRRMARVGSLTSTSIMSS